MARVWSKFSILGLQIVIKAYGLTMTKLWLLNKLRRLAWTKKTTACSIWNFQSTWPISNRHLLRWTTDDGIRAFSSSWTTPAHLMDNTPRVVPSASVMSWPFETQEWHNKFTSLLTLGIHGASLTFAKFQPALVISYSYHQFPALHMYGAMVSKAWHQSSCSLSNH